MIFDEQHYPAIKQACQERKEIEFQALKRITAFVDSEAPVEWTSYPPCLLPPEGYAQVFACSGADLRGALMRLELVIHLDGGQVLYRRASEDQVGIRVIWPMSA